MNDLYGNELRLHKNFFQPVMKLQSKERIGGKVKRRYEEKRRTQHAAPDKKLVPRYVRD